MKPLAALVHSLPKVVELAREQPRSKLSVQSIHGEHAEFVWASLQRLGVREADLEDLLQEVFIVVHRRLDSFNGTSQMRTWLYGIALRVAAAYRRRGYVGIEAATPEGALEQSRKQADLVAVLDGMDIEKRAIFVMYEIDEMSCDEIASILDVPVGTVHSRLHSARKNFESALGRFRAKTARRSRS